MKKTRGRPREFNEETVKKTIMESFWRKGFSATSLDELAAATGLTRPSLYGAFGDKVNMYLQSMHVYTDFLVEQTGSAVRSAHSLSEALTGFFEVILDICYQEEKPLGCFLMGTAMVEAPAYPEIQELLKDKMQEIENVFFQIIQKFTPGLEQAEQLFAAQQTTALLYYLGLRARAGFEKKGLKITIQTSVDHIVQKLKQQELV